MPPFPLDKGPMTLLRYTGQSPTQEWQLGKIHTLVPLLPPKSPLRLLLLQHKTPGRKMSQGGEGASPASPLPLGWLIRQAYVDMSRRKFQALLVEEFFQPLEDLALDDELQTRLALELDAHDQGRVIKRHHPC